MQINCKKSFSFCQVFLWLLNVKERLPRQSPTLSGLDGYITLAHGERPRMGDVGPHTSPRCAHLHPGVATARPRMPTTPPRHAHETSTCLGGRSCDCEWTATIPGIWVPTQGKLHGHSASTRPDTEAHVLPGAPTKYLALPDVDAYGRPKLGNIGRPRILLGIHEAPHVEAHKHGWKATRLGCGLGWRPIAASSLGIHGILLDGHVIRVGVHSKPSWRPTHIEWAPIARWIGRPHTLRGLPR